MLFAVLITILAAGFTNVGKALQKRGMRTLPRLVYDVKVVREYLKHPTWALGLALDIGGGLLSVVALANAPVSVVQPIASGGLAILAVFSHFYLEERLKRREWAAVGLAAAGTMGVAACAPEPASGADVAVSLRGALALAALLAAAHAALRWARAQAAAGGLPSSGGSGGRLSTGGGRGGGAASGSAGGSAAWHRVVGAQRVEELALGAQAGACFALSAAACRAGFLLAPHTRAAAPAGLAAAAALTTAGVVAQTRGMKDGAAMVVCTAGAVATMLTGATAGVLVLGEGLPPTRRGRVTWLLCWAAIAAGVGGISSAGGAGPGHHGHSHSGGGGSLLPGGAAGKSHLAGSKIAITPLKVGITAAVAAVGGATTPGATSGRLLLPLFVRPPKEPDSAL